MQVSFLRRQDANVWGGQKAHAKKHRWLSEGKGSVEEGIADGPGGSAKRIHLRFTRKKQFIHQNKMLKLAVKKESKPGFLAPPKTRAMNV
jgi:hypothetical protein